MFFDYFEEKRCDCVIARFGKVNFRKPIDQKSFQGILRFDKMKSFDETVVVKATAEYDNIDAIPMTFCLKVN